MRIVEPVLTPERLITVLLADPNRAAPTEVSWFAAVDGSRAPGTEFAVRMPGPWDVPVRVIGRTARSFRLATPYGHTEAGGRRVGPVDVTERWRRRG